VLSIPVQEACEKRLMSRLALLPSAYSVSKHETIVQEKKREERGLLRRRERGSRDDEPHSTLLAVSEHPGPWAPVCALENGRKKGGGEKGEEVVPPRLFSIPAWLVGIRRPSSPCLRASYPLVLLIAAGRHKAIEKKKEGKRTVDGRQGHRHARAVSVSTERKENLT